MFQNSYLDPPLPRDARGSFSAPQRENLMASLAVNPQKCGIPKDRYSQEFLTLTLVLTQSPQFIRITMDVFLPVNGSSESVPGK